MRRLVLALTMSACIFSGPLQALAQEVCAPDAGIKAADQYAAQPFSARAWRVLNGLGDPGIEAGSYAFSGWEQTDAWRKRVAELAPDAASLQNVAYDCRIGYPLEVLNARVSQLGAADPYIRQWLFAQDKVLRACESSGDVPVLPPPLEVKPDLAQMQQEDRAYQEASIQFYRNKPLAVQLFKAIGQSSSPHKAAARYNMANLLANANNVVEARKEAKAILADPSLASVHLITEELLGYIANIEDTAQGWTELLEQTITTLNLPQTQITGNAQKERAYASALYDIEYAGVRAKRDDWWIEGKLPQDPTLSKALVDVSRKHPIALWMMAGQSVNGMYGRAPWALAGNAWSAWSKSYVDRALALQPAGAGVTGLARDVLLAQSAVSDEASRQALWAKAKAAWAAAQSSCGKAAETGGASELTMQAVRLSAQAGQYAEALDALASLKLDASLAYQDVILPKLMQHLLATGNAAEGRKLRDRLITPAFLAGFSGDSRSWRLLPYSNFLKWVAEDEKRFHEAGALSAERLSSPILNFVPAATLRRMADDAGFSAEQRALLSRAAWTRDYVRGRMPGKAETDRMLELNPEIKAALEKVRTEFPKLSSERQWLLTILRNPRFGILVNSPDWTEPLESRSGEFSAIDSYDHNDKNWWCPLSIDRHLGAVRTAFDGDSGLGAVTSNEQLKALTDPGAVERLTQAREALLKAHPMVQNVAWKEVDALAKAPSAPKKLALDAVRWGKASKGDDGAPEALALAVKATRYGCNWAGGHGAQSKAAQALLATKFTKTTWAAQTPYWFNCTRQEWDKEYNKVTTCEPKPWPKQAPLK